MSRFVLVFVLIAVFSRECAAQAPQQSAGGSILSSSAFPSLLDSVSMGGFDYLEASFALDAKKASLTFAPLLGLADYYEFLSETRFKVAQKEKRTTLGLSFSWNPLSPRGRRGARLWREQSLSSVEERALNAVRLRARANALEEAYLRLAAASQDTTVARLGKSLQALGDSISNEDAGSPEEKRLSGLASAAQLELINAILPLQDTALEEAWDAARQAQVRIKEAEATAAAAFESATTAFSARLFSPAPPVLRLSYQASLFEVLGGSPVDADGDGLNDNAESLQSHSIALEADWRPSAMTQLSGLVSIIEARSSAEQGEQLDRSLGFGLTFSAILAVLDPDFAQSKAYRESLFVPSVVAGLSFERLKCTEPASVGCGADGITRQYSLTPFVDLKINKSAQLRFGVPIRRSRAASGVADATHVGVTTLVSFQIAPPA